MKEQNVSKEKPKDATLRAGYMFVFSDGDNEIVAYGSAVSGKEIVYFNDRIVSEKRHFGFNSRHQFSLDGQQYEVNFVARNVLMGSIECSVLKGDRLLGREEQSFFRGGKSKPFWLILGISFSISFVVGFAVTTWFLK